MKSSKTAISGTIESCVDRIKEIQNPDGGFPQARLEEKSGVWTTAGLLTALKLAGETFTADYMQRAIKWVQTQQSPGGGFTLTHVRITCTEPTAFAIMALSEAYEELRSGQILNSLKGAVKWLLKTQNKNGGWGFFPREESITTSTSNALIALARASTVTKDDDIDRSIQKGVKWLKKCKEKSGKKGWGLYCNSTSSPASTALAILALKKCGLYDNLISDGAEYLCETILTQGYWSDLVDRHRGLDFERFALPLCIAALAEAGVDIASTAFQKGLKDFLAKFKNGLLEYAQGIVVWPTRDGLYALSKIGTTLKTGSLIKLLEINLKLRQELENTKTEREEIISSVQPKFNLLKALCLLFSFSLLIIISLSLLYTLKISLESLAIVVTVALAFWSFFATIVYKLELES